MLMASALPFGADHVGWSALCLFRPQEAGPVRVPVFDSGGQMEFENGLPFPRFRGGSVSLWTRSRGRRGRGSDSRPGQACPRPRGMSWGGPGHSLLASPSKSCCEETSSKKQRASARFLPAARRSHAPGPKAITCPALAGPAALSLIIQFMTACCGARGTSGPRPSGRA